MSIPVTPLRDRPELVARAATWFAEKWGLPEGEYRASMEACCAADPCGSPVPQWYIALDDERIVAGAGVIENDFHERRDLAPNVCAVFVEPDRRGRGIARELLAFLCDDMASHGVSTLYLLTDLDSFYERLGWRFREMVRDAEGELGRMYEKTTERKRAEAGPAGPSAAPRACEDDPGTARKLADNRANWDDRAAVHAASEFYGIDRLVADPHAVSGVARRDLAVLRPHLPESGLAGLALLHLQCHIGDDTLSWKRFGAAEVWGLDFSPASLERARTLADRCGERVTYVEGDARFAADAIDRTFDVIVTGTGAITWLPELSDWARSIARLLAPGGVFLLRDDHPLLDALGCASLTVTEDYLSGTGSIDSESDESYTEGSAGTIAHTVCHNWRHDFGEVLESLIAAGLAIEAFAEHPTCEWRALPFLEKTDQGFVVPDGMPKIPLTFSVVARKA